MLYLEPFLKAHAGIRIRTVERTKRQGPKPCGFGHSPIPAITKLILRNFKYYSFGKKNQYPTVTGKSSITIALKKALNIGKFTI